MNPCASYKHEHKGPYRPGLNGTMVCIACDEAVMSRPASKPEGIPYRFVDNPDLYFDYVQQPTEDKRLMEEIGSDLADAISKPSLSLLVIDLGESCVVKNEGPSDVQVIIGGNTVDLCNITPRLCHFSFDELKKDIEAMDEKPLPRIEQEAFDPTAYLLHFENGREISLSNEQYHELCKIAGVPIQVYEGGKWENLVAMGKLAPLGKIETKCSVWRYTR